MKILVAKPRGFCAGVDRAITIVETALARYGTPIYVRHAIVHNRHVIERLEEMGAIFVEELCEIPRGARVVLSAHGVSPSVREEAANLGLNVIDATCPLVTKVHMEVRRYAKEGYSVLLIGHENHVEVVGTMGEAPESVTVVGSVEDAKRVQLEDPTRVAYVTQTTLSLDDTREIIRELTSRFPLMKGPARPDICYATQNRQDMVKALASRADVIYIAGSKESSNANRMVEVARAMDVRAYLIEDRDALTEDVWHADARVIGLSSGASTPEHVVQGIVERLKALGATAVEELSGPEERIVFAMPGILRNGT